MYVNSKTKSRNRIAKISSSAGHDVEADQEIAQELNYFFQSVFVTEDDNYLIWFNDFMRCIYGEEVAEPFNTSQSLHGATMENVFFTPDDVRKLLVSINPNKAMGPDDVHPRVLKEAADFLFFPLYCIMRQSIDQCKVPDMWKFANVTPIFKKGCRSVSSNYRPVSLTSQVCKLLEKLIRDKTVTFVERIICNEQHGFRKGRSCLTNLLSTLEEWTDLYDRGLPFDTLYLDFKKAFDSVPHARLIYKLQSCGVVGNLCYWFEDFLRDRKQRVCVNGSKSSWKNVTSGVPQGSVIGPLLFLLYVNDLPGIVTANCKIFADDTKLYHPILSLADAESLQLDIDNLLLWADNWLLRFNESKCKVLHFGRKNPKNTYFMNGISLENATEEKDLGVLISDDLSFSKHIAKCAAKANSMLGVIKRCFDYLDIDSFLALYKSFVRPHLEYCVQAWSPHLERDKQVLEKVQRRATKLLPELCNLAYEDRLKRLGLTTLEDRRVRGDLIEMFKILNGHVNIEYSLFFTHRVYEGLRGHPLCVEFKRSRVNMRKFFFSSRTTALWNSLPVNVVTARSVNAFKNRLDSYVGIGSV